MFESMLQQIRIIKYSIVSSVETRGWSDTVKMIVIAVVDMIGDFISGIRAHSFVDSALYITGESAKFANFYQPVRRVPFMNLLRKKNIPCSGGFVDIGSGTGKALLLALEYGFDKVVGVEIVDSLCVLAKSNFEKKSIPQSKYSLICADALDYNIQHEDHVFFFNDPFSDEVFSKFLDKLLSCKIDGREFVLIYKNNNKRKIDSYISLQSKYRSYVFESWGNYFEVILLK